MATVIPQSGSDMDYLSVLSYGSGDNMRESHTDVLCSAPARLRHNLHVIIHACMTGRNHTSSAFPAGLLYEEVKIYTVCVCCTGESFILKFKELIKCINMFFFQLIL